MKDISRIGQKRVKIGEKDILAFSFAGLTLFALAVATASFISARSCSRLAKGANFTLVQQLDGETFIANPKPTNYRDPKAVRNFVNKWVTHVFTLNKKLGRVGNKEVLDRGLLEKGQRIPTNVVSGSFAWPATKRDGFIAAYLNEGLVPVNYFSGEANSGSIQLVEIDSLSDAKLIDEEKQVFTVNVVATVIRYKNGKPTGDENYYRRKITVGAIPIPQKKPDVNASIYEKLRYQWRKEGLQIRTIEALSFE